MEQRTGSGDAVKLLRNVKQNRMEREHVRTTIESPGWRVFFERTIKPELDDWKAALLTRVEISDGERRGLVLARQTLLAGIQSLYDKTEVPVPEWFQKEIDG